MKKLLAITLALLMTLHLCACSAFAKPTESLDEAAVLEFNHKVYEANQLDTIFSHHESIAYTFRNLLDSTKDGYIWETADSIYQERGTQSAEFDRDRVHYMMTTDETTGEVNVYAGVDIDQDYQPFYCYAGDTEKEFFDAEHDHVVELYEADGLIHSASQYDETLSKRYVEEDMGLEYEGQIIRTEIVVNAETYEVLESCEVMVQDDEEIVVSKITVAYDTPEPASSHTMRANFERPSENRMTLTFVVDAGTDHEFSREITVPVNTEAGMMYGNSPFVYFNDPDCETLTHWDRMSDNVMYIFTNPDDELNEKFQTLLDEVQQLLETGE